METHDDARTRQRIANLRATELPAEVIAQFNALLDLDISLADARVEARAAAAKVHDLVQQVVQAHRHFDTAIASAKLQEVHDGRTT